MMSRNDQPPKEKEDASSATATRERSGREGLFARVNASAAGYDPETNTLGKGNVSAEVGVSEDVKMEKIQWLKESCTIT